MLTEKSLEFCLDVCFKSSGVFTGRQEVKAFLSPVVIISLEIIVQVK